MLVRVAIAVLAVSVGITGLPLRSARAGDPMPTLARVSAAGAVGSTGLDGTPTVKVGKLSFAFSPALGAPPEGTFGIAEILCTVI